MPAEACAELPVARRTMIVARDYDLAATLNSGQAFRWEPSGLGWEGVVGAHWVELRATAGTILAETAEDLKGWDWLCDYLQTSVELDQVVATFPSDPAMRQAVATCRGLRLLRQDPWECLASFILSSTKQIVQIRQILRILCARYGRPAAVPPGRLPAYQFPTPSCLAALSEADLRECKMGFRAPYLLAAARAVAEGTLNLARLDEFPTDQARAELSRLSGIGPKIADCVLLFAYGRQDAFPVDVWVRRALHELYFKRRRASLRRLEEFARTHFGPYAGYAQQYLFHYIRTQAS